MQGDGPSATLPLTKACKSLSDRTEKLFEKWIFVSLGVQDSKVGGWISFVATFLNWICLGLLSLVDFDARHVVD
jgi:hypothetical protein